MVPEQRYVRSEIDTWEVVQETRWPGQPWVRARAFWPVPLDPDTALMPAELRGVLIEGV